MTDEIFDIVVVGSGGGGCAAAFAGVALGNSVCLIEKGETVGGGTLSSYGSLWIGNSHLAAEAGLEDSYDEALAYAQFVSGGTGLGPKVEAYVRQGARVLRRLEEWGMRFRLLGALPEIFYPHAPGSKPDGRRMVDAQPVTRAEIGDLSRLIARSDYCQPGVSWGDAVAWGGFANEGAWDRAELDAREKAGMLAAGSALVARFLHGFLSRGGSLRTGLGAERLLVEDGRVAGVLTDKGVLRARRGVVLACGGYEGNPELVKRFEGLPDWANPFSPHNRGDALTMATEIGAAVFRTQVNNSLLVGCAVGDEKEFYSIGLRGMPWPGAIAVNADGRRFCDESSFQDAAMEFQKFDRHRHRFANLPAYMIFDDEHRRNYPVAGRPVGAEVPDWVPRASSPAELATLLDIDPAGLAATVAEFNHNATEGHDPQFGRGRSAFSKSTAGDARRKHSQLAPLATPPFYGIRLKVGGICAAGVLTDVHGRAVDARGKPMDGLYVCGNAAAPTDTGVGYQGGTSIGSGVIFGVLAAEHMSEAGRG